MFCKSILPDLILLITLKEISADLLNWLLEMSLSNKLIIDFSTSTVINLVFNVLAPFLN